MKVESARLIHAGLNFVLGGGQPLQPVNHMRRFQDALREVGLDYQSVDAPDEQRLIVMRRQPSPLQIEVATIGPNIGQLLIVAANPVTTFDLFAQEADAAISAFRLVWNSQDRVLVQVAAVIRELYETTSEHAFQELWEQRLGQPGQALAAFERPIRGGGLRFVLDPQPPDESATVEVRIESYLADTRKIFVETQFVWPAPSEMASRFEARTYLSQVIAYRSRVQKFMSQGGTSNVTR